MGSSFTEEKGIDSPVTEGFTMNPKGEKLTVKTVKDIMESRSMSKILIAGMTNIEVTCKVDEFPIKYEPIAFNFFGVNMGVAGVGYNLAKALTALKDQVKIASLVGDDMAGNLIESELNAMGEVSLISKKLSQTPLSVVLYDHTGARRIYCDLKDIQETPYDYSEIDITSYDLVAACNINFSRPLLKKAKEAGIKIATDVHVLSDINDEFNREFMEYADILFLSNEYIAGNERAFVEQIAEKYNNEIIVVGRGSAGALMYVREENKFVDMPAAKAEKIVNTVGAGDCLFATFISMYAKGLEPEKCLELAQKAAAYKIGFDGAAKGFMELSQLEK